MVAPTTVSRFLALSHSPQTWPDLIVSLGNGMGLGHCQRYCLAAQMGLGEFGSAAPFLVYLGEMGGMGGLFDKLKTNPLHV